MAKKKSFTLIELVMVIVILSVLAAVALPRFFNLQDEAKEAAERGVVGAVRSGIMNYYANQCVTATCAWPETLSYGQLRLGEPCAPDHVCFDRVLQMGGITEGDWMPTSGGWVGPAGGVYKYNSENGSFLLQ